jgi:tetratricopeptide (TPR) repeat protein
MDFCYQLIGHFDKNSSRWTDAEIEKIVGASGGNIGFLVAIVRSASGIEDFDQIDQLVSANKQDMLASITTYIRWAFLQLRDFEDEQRTLLFLNDVSPCDVSDIERVVKPKRDILRVLGKLLDLGLIERESDNLYRLTPMLSRRLNRDLVRPELLGWLRDALVEFVKRPVDLVVDGHEYVRIESRIQASLLSESGELPDNVMAFVSAAHWFQAGVRLYHARRREPAYRILKKAYLKRSEFDGASRTELARYFCLSATRNRKYPEAEACIALLDSAHQTKSMAAFLRADVYEYKREFGNAISEYQKSLELNKGKTDRLERTYRPLIRCILASWRPDYEMARDYAVEALRLRRTIFSLMGLARVYLHWKHLGLKHQRDTPANIERLFLDALAELEAHPGVGSAHFELKAEEAEFLRDFSNAVDYMDAAIRTDPRFELRSERWRLMAKTKLPAFAEKVLAELDAAKHNLAFKSDWVPFLPTLAETYAFSLKVTGRSFGSLNAFAPELSGDEIGALVSRVKRTN